MEAAHIMRIIRNGKGFGDLMKAGGRLIDKHAAAELVQQHHHARA
jgi:urease gamma subunit